jgi:hypothetical protein
LLARIIFLHIFKESGRPSNLLLSFFVLLLAPYFCAREKVESGKLKVEMWWELKAKTILTLATTL